MEESAKICYEVRYEEILNCLPVGNKQYGMLGGYTFYHFEPSSTEPPDMGLPPYWHQIEVDNLFNKYV